KPAGTFDTPSLRNPDWAKLPYELSLLSPAPREVLQIGLGSGSWVRAIANNPDIDRLTVVESDPGFLDIAALRDDIAYLSDNPSVSIVTDNARRWLELNPDKTFDVIVLNTASLRNAYASNFLSREFFDLVKWHLNPNGLFIFDTENSERAMLTGCSAFVYGLRFQNRIVVSMSPIMPNANRWKKSLSTEHIDDMPILNLKKKEDRAFFKKLDNVENADDPVFGSLIEDCSKILRRTRSLEPFSDDNMGDEWIRRYRQK
ncbi:MAG: fused MFS/spermidine synthase, partial [Alphaproteobacteria bacterium]|nr:fused MFS/spermidine synthase [Alphaproteobacteria bacterium]